MFRRSLQRTQAVDAVEREFGRARRAQTRLVRTAVDEARARAAIYPPPTLIEVAPQDCPPAPPPPRRA